MGLKKGVALSCGARKWATIPAMMRQMDVIPFGSVALIFGKRDLAGVLVSWSWSWSWRCWWPMASGERWRGRSGITREIGGGGGRGAGRRRRGGRCKGRIRRRERRIRRRRKKRTRKKERKMRRKKKRERRRWKKVKKEILSLMVFGTDVRWGQA